MSFALLAFPGNNQISPWWYELKKSELLWNVFAKGATLRPRNALWETPSFCQLSSVADTEK